MNFKSSSIELLRNKHLIEFMAENLNVIFYKKSKECFIHNLPLKRLEIVLPKFVLKYLFRLDHSYKILHRILDHS